MSSDSLSHAGPVRSPLRRSHIGVRGSRRRYLLLLAGTALFVLYAARVDYAELVGHVRGFELRFAATIVALNLLPGLLKSARWRQLLRICGVRPRPLRDYLAVNSSFFLGLVTPGTSGELARALSVETQEHKGFAIIIFEKITDLVVLALAVLAAAILHFASEPLSYVLVAALLLATACAYALYVRFDRAFTAPLKAIVQRVAAEKHVQNAKLTYWEFLHLLERRALVFQSALYSLALWIVPLVQMYLIYRGMGFTLPLGLVAFTFFLPYLVGVVSMIPLGLGTFDLSLSELSRIQGLSFASEAAVVPVFYRAFVTLPLILFGYLCQVALALSARKAGRE